MHICTPQYPKRLCSGAKDSAWSFLVVKAKKGRKSKLLGRMNKKMSTSHGRQRYHGLPRIFWLNMVLKLDFIVHRWVPTYFALTKASCRVFVLVSKINNQPFSGHCNGVNYIWQLLIKYLVMLWSQSQIVLCKHYDLSVINVICIICEQSDTLSKSRLLTSVPILGEIATWSVSTQTQEEKGFDNGLINWISGLGEWAVCIDPIK